MVFQDIKFSMPFSASGEPTTTVEDLQDLLDFEKSNPGQVRTKFDLNCASVARFAPCYFVMHGTLFYVNEFMIH